MRNIIFGLIFFLFNTTPAISCTPISPQPAEIRMPKILEESSEIFVGTILSVEKYMAKLPSGSDIILENPAERVVFRVDRVLKGSLVPGEHYITETLLGGGSCGISAINDPAWAYDVNKNWEPIPKKLSKQWLLSINPSQPHQLTSGDKPIDMAIENGELEILERLQNQKRKQ